MRLKEIKPGMVIHCKNDEEKKALLEEAERLGYLWYSGRENPTEKVYGGNTIHFHAESEFSDFKYITWSDKTEGVTEFSDLILPELTAEEVLRIRHEICREAKRNCCSCILLNKNSDYSDTIRVCAQWKSDHEKKEPEIETVDICRIIEIQPDGRKRCVHEEDLASGSTDAEIKILVEAELKQYVSKHDGEFIAVHEVVSRVKK